MTFIHLKFSHFFTTIFRSDRQIHFKKIIIILSWRIYFITFSKRSNLRVYWHMFFSRCFNWEILGGIETFMTPCHYKYIKQCTKLIYFWNIRPYKHIRALQVQACLHHHSIYIVNCISLTSWNRLVNINEACLQGL